MLPTKKTLTRYRVTVAIGGSSWSYLISALCHGDATEWVIRNNRRANFGNTFCVRA